MIGWTPTYSIEAERAIRGINRVAGLVSNSRRFIAALPPPRGRTLAAELNDVAIVRAVSVLESYLTDRADTLMRRDLPVPYPATQLVQYLHENVLASFRGSFDRGSKRFWDNALGVELKRGPNWSALADFRELRNAIVHSLGFVRAGDKLSSSIERRIKSVTGTPSIYSGRIPVTDNDFDDLAVAVRAYVMWTDRMRP